MIDKLNFNIQQPIPKLEQVTMLIYGDPKIGKSTFCSRFPNGFFVATEPGLNHLVTRNVRVKNWSEFKSVLSMLRKAPSDVRPIIIDTIDKLCDMLERDILERYNITCLGDLKYGKGTVIFTTEFKAAVDDLLLLNSGIVFVSHSDVVEIDTPLGSSKKFVPSIPKAARKQILNLCDMIAFATAEETIDPKTGERVVQRVMHLSPTNVWEAGDRTRRFPQTIPFKYQIFKSYFDKEIQQ